ncbi:hypothetical protein LXL04_037281 [Taraxacum kok-saghyz]
MEGKGEGTEEHAVGRQHYIIKNEYFLRTALKEKTILKKWSLHCQITPYAVLYNCFETVMVLNKFAYVIRKLDFAEGALRNDIIVISFRRKKAFRSKNAISQSMLCETTPFRSKNQLNGLFGDPTPFRETAVSLPLRNTDDHSTRPPPFANQHYASILLQKWKTSLMMDSETWILKQGISAISQSTLCEIDFPLRNFIFTAKCLFCEMKLR